MKNFFITIKEKYPQAYDLFSKVEVNPIAFLDSQGIYINIFPKFYIDGICWQLQIFWYKENIKLSPKKLDKYEFIEGTMIYGDNNEFPERHDAEIGGILFGFEILERKLSEINPLQENISCITDEYYNFNEIFVQLRKKRITELF